MSSNKIILENRKVSTVKKITDSEMLILASNFEGEKVENSNDYSLHDVSGGVNNYEITENSNLAAFVEDHGGDIYMGH